MTPLLSVIIPCYNNGKYLLEMIDCFRHQTSSSWEMIIVDDGSTDDTPQVVEKSISDLPNVFFYKRDREPKGSVVCRNIGFEKANGKYVCHLDADDLVSSTFVEHRVALMELHPEIDYASFPAKAFSKRDSLPTFESDVQTWGVGDNSIDLLDRFLRVKYPFSVWNNIYRKDSIKFLPWDEKVKIYTDFSFIVPGIIAGLKHLFSGLKEVDYYYRQEVANKVAMTSDFISQEKCDSTIYLFSKTLDSLKEKGLFEKYKGAFFNFILLHFTRLLMSKDASDSNKMIEYLTMCEKYYDCKRRFSIITLLRKFKQPMRYRIMCVEYALLFGNTYYLKQYWQLVVCKKSSRSRTR